MTDQTPAAWLLRETTSSDGLLTDDNSRIMCGHMFMSDATARQAAKRKTGRWRKVVAVAVYAEPPPAPDPQHWRCFHCGEVCLTEHDARLHFGSGEDQDPACQIKGSEGGLIEALRNAEEDAWSARQALQAESADGLMAWRGAIRRHQVALQAAEETGFERGMDAMRQQVERLRRIANVYGDLTRMAMCNRPDWQQEIDEAMAWVADNPEPRCPHGEALSLPCADCVREHREETR